MSEFTEILNFLEEEEKKIKKSKDHIKPINVQKNPQLIVNNKIIDKNVIKKPTVQGFDIDELQDNMRKQLINDFNRSKKYIKKYIYVSELILSPRIVFYNRKNISIDLQEEFKFSNLYLIRKVGNAVHSAIQKIYKFDEVEKTVISEKFNVKGRIDAILDKSIIELKTTDKEKYQDTYDINHFNQGTIYAYIIGEYGYEINNISIVYIYRDLKMISIHNLPPDPGLAKSFLDRSLIITDCLENNVVPSIIDIPEDECGWCSYKKYCKKSELPKSKSKFLL